MATKNNDLSNQPSAELSERAEHLPRVAPLIDVYENKDEILLIGDLPGVAQEALTVRLEGAELRIEGTQSDAQRPGYMPLRFVRTFQVPDTIDPQGTSASLKQGVLTLRLAKSQAAKPRRIEINVG